MGGRRIWKGFGTACLAFVVISLLQVFCLKFINPPFTAMMAWEAATRMDPHGLTGLRGGWRSLGRISPHLRRAVLAGEDQRFLSHHGFDLIEMNEAVEDLLQGERARGASTITMQVARTVFLWPGRSWPRKALEAYYTVIIEMFWTKERILEVYLNTVDWGEGVRGAEAASIKYFRSSSQRTSREQAALLAAILPNPHRWSAARPAGAVLRRKARILHDMGNMPLLPKL